MITVAFITALFYEVDEQLRAIPKHPEAHLWPSEVGTLGLLHALKGVGNRAFYRWLTRDYRRAVPHASPSGRGSFVSSRRITTGRGSSWPLRRCSASSTPIGIELIPPHARRPQSPPDRPQRPLRTTAGLSGANSVCCSISGGWWSRVRIPVEGCR